MNRREFIVGAAVAGASFSALGRAAVGRGVPSVAPTEVLVAGGGPAGFIAAIAAATCSFNYTVPMTAWGDDATQPATIKLTVNGVEKLSFSSTEIAGSWVEKTASFSPGELKAGQNEFVWTISGDRTDNNPTIGFDCHTFSLTPERHGLGTFIVVE